MEIGVGWLGFTEQELNDMDLNVIQAGYKGKIDMLKACYGSSTDKPKPIKPAPDEIRKFAKRQNKKQGL